MTNKLPIYRTIKQCHCSLKELDENTAIAEWFLYQLFKNELVKYLPSEIKSLLYHDKLLNFLEYTEVQ